MGMATSPLHAEAGRLGHEQPVRHRLHGRWSRITGPPRLIDLGHREITPGAIDEAQVEGIAIECCGAGFGVRGFVETQRWRAPLEVPGLAVTNLTPHALLGNRRRIISYSQAHGALWGVIDDLKDHGNICRGLLVCRHGRHSLPDSGVSINSDKHTASAAHRNCPASLAGWNARYFAGVPRIETGGEYTPCSTSRHHSVPL